MADKEQTASVSNAPENKPRPKAKTRENKAKERAQKTQETAAGMRSILKRESQSRRSAGKPSVFDDQEEAEPTPKSHLFGGLTPSMMLLLAAPHTWAASIMPVFLAICLVAADTGTVSALMAIVLLLISILMQSAVNAFNDYSDFVAGTDTADNQDDPLDAVLVYNDVKPYGVRNLAVAFTAIAFLLGIFVVVRAGWIPLVIAIIGAVVAYLYSGGPKPLSYLPVGELVSGFVMGGLITLASYTALAGYFSWKVLLLALPLMIGIALIMFTNNTCDIEKDRVAKRDTLAAKLGRKDSVFLYHVLVAAWIVLIALLVAIFYPTGSLVLVFLLAAVPPVMGLMRNRLVHSSRDAAMSAITSANAILGLVYGAAIMLSAVVVIVA